jgi:glycerophosphoryl diester phosphodiesterase
MKLGFIKNKVAKRLMIIGVGCVLAIASVYAALAWSTGIPAAERSFFKKDGTRPLVIAHRGGAGLWPENTLYAFENAVNLGVDVVEIDVRSTSDGTLVVMHDATVNRTTDGAGRVSDMTLAELKKYDAGFRWSSDNGKTFPMRGRGITVPTLEEVFTALPEMRFNIEPKQDAPSITEPLCSLIRKHRMADKVIIASFSNAIMYEFRRTCPEVATSASPVEVSKFLAMQTAGLETAYSPAMQALQVPEYIGGLRVLTTSVVEAAHNRNLEVHAWTINETEDMLRLMNMGVDGLMTDYPDRLIKVVGRPLER